MPNVTVTQALKVIADLIEGQRIAGPHYYEVVWIKDHFVCRRIRKVDKGQYLIIELRAKDINEGLSCAKWSTIESRLRVLIETEVIK